MIETRAVVRDQRICFEDAKVDAFLASREGKAIRVRLADPFKARSVAQNAWFHKLVAILAEHCGYNEAQMKDAIKWLFLRVPGHDGLPDTVRATSSLSTAEMADLCERVRQWASADLGVYLPSPGEDPEGYGWAA